MDVLLMMAAFSACIISLILACRTERAGMLTLTLSTIGMVYFAGWFVYLGAKTDAFSPTKWSGEVETGPATLLAMVLAMAAPFLLNWGEADDGPIRDH